MSFIHPKPFYRACMAAVVRNIIAERKRQGLKQNQVSARCGMSPGNMCKLESGYHSMTLTTLFIIAAALEVEPGFLLNGALPRRYNRRKRL